jgi:lipocalin
MRQILIVLALLTFIGCGKTEFCGQAVDEGELSNLKGKVEGKGMTIGIQLSFAAAKEFGDNSEIQFEIDYSVEDTVVINVINLPDENSAKKVSCIIADNKVVEQTNVVFVRYMQGDNIKAFKY